MVRSALRLIRPTLLLTVFSNMAACQMQGPKTSQVLEVAPKPLATRYHGFAKVNERAVKMVAHLDLMPSPVRPDSYRGYLRIAPGHITSHEYVTIQFPDIRFDRSKGNLQFQSPDENFSIQNAAVNGNRLTATLTVRSENLELPLELVDSESQRLTTFSAFVTTPVADPFTGHYIASCNEKTSTLQIEASRWRGYRSGDQTLFAGYRLHARIAAENAELCIDSKRPCIAQSYAHLNAHFFSRTFESQDGFNCKAQDRKLICSNGCNYVREEDSGHAILNTWDDEDRNERQVHIDNPEGTIPAARGHEGQYYGYLHHEGRDNYQLVALNVRSAPLTDPATGAARNGEFVLGVATLYFGDGDSNEFAAYRFKEVTLTDQKFPLILDGNGEVTMQIDSWQGSVIRGVWYGKSFGKVGTIELLKGSVPKLPEKTPSLPAIAGHYTGAEWEFELGVSSNLSEDAADFYPLKIYGWAKEKIRTAKRRTIQEGVYDLYTGAIALKIDDGRMVIGRVTNGGMELYWTPLSMSGTPLPDQQNHFFQRAKGAAVSLLDTRHCCR